MKEEEKKEEGGKENSGNVEKKGEKVVNIVGWEPKTEIGRKVKQGLIKNIDEIIENGYVIKEPEIVDVLLPNLKKELLLIGQAKGKFGGGQRRAFKQTQKKTMEGNKPSFTTCVVVGTDGYVGIGFGKAKETVPAREKAVRNAKLNLIKIIKGCGSWECSCGKPHSIPFTVSGKSGSVEIKLMPAPKGTGLVVENECKKILSIAGIKDILSKSKGTTGTKTNMVNACFNALKKLTKIKVQSKYKEKLGIIKVDNE